MERECEMETQHARRCGSDAKMRRGRWVSWSFPGEDESVEYSSTVHDFNCL